MAKQRTQKESLYLQVVILDNGQAAFGKYVSEQTPTSTIITTKNSTGKESKRNYELFDEIEGLVKTTGVWDKETEAGAKWEMTSITVINSEGTQENVQCNFKSPFSSSLIQRLENIDLSKPITLKVFRIKDKEKSKLKGKDIYNEMLLPYQLDENKKLVSVKSKYAKLFSETDLLKENNLNTNFLPEFKKSEKKVKGETVVSWNTDDYEESLRQIAMSVDKDCKQASELRNNAIQNASNESSKSTDVKENDLVSNDFQGDYLPY